MKLIDEYLTLLEQEKWSGKIHLKHHFKKGTFEKGSGSVAKSVEGSGGTYQQKMARLNFYINRAGKNLSPKDKSKLEKAKEKLAAKHGKKI